MQRDSARTLERDTGTAARGGPREGTDYRQRVKMVLLIFRLRAILSAAPKRKGGKRRRFGKRANVLTSYRRQGDWQTPAGKSLQG